MNPANRLIILKITLALLTKKSPLPPSFKFLHTNLSLVLTVIRIHAVHKYPISIGPILVLSTHLSTYTSTSPLQEG